jgi:hypothetical protein
LIFSPGGDPIFRSSAWEYRDGSKGGMHDASVDAVRLVEVDGVDSVGAEAGRVQNLHLGVIRRLSPD